MVDRAKLLFFMSGRERRNGTFARSDNVRSNSKKCHFSLWDGSLLVVFDARNKFLDWVQKGGDLHRVHDAPGFLFARKVSGLDTAAMDSGTQGEKCYSLKLHDGSEVRFCLDKEPDEDVDIVHAKWISFLGDDAQAGGVYTHFFKSLLRSDGSEAAHFRPSEGASQVFGLQQSPRPLSMPEFGSGGHDIAYSPPDNDDFASSIPSSALPMQALDKPVTTDFQRTTAFIRDASATGTAAPKMLKLPKPLDFPTWDAAPKPPAVPPPMPPPIPRPCRPRRICIICAA